MPVAFICQASKLPLDRSDAPFAVHGREPQQIAARIEQDAAGEHGDAWRARWLSRNVRGSTVDDDRAIVAIDDDEAGGVIER